MDDRGLFPVEPDFAPIYRDFLMHLNAYAKDWRSLGMDEDDVLLQVREDCLVVAIDVVDRQEQSVLSVPRADFCQQGVMYGFDESRQLVGHMNPDPKKNNISPFNVPEATPKQCAYAIAHFFASTLCRPVERREWRRRDFVHKEWFFSDTETRLQNRSVVCFENLTIGAPDQVVVVRSFGPLKKA